MSCEFRTLLRVVEICFSKSLGVMPNCLQNNLLK